MDGPALPPDANADQTPITCTDSKHARPHPHTSHGQADQENGAVSPTSAEPYSLYTIVGPT